MPDAEVAGRGHGGRYAGRGGGGRGRGATGRGSQGRGSPRSVTANLSSDGAVPQLRFTPPGNWDIFKRKMTVAALEKFGNLGRLIQDEAYYSPPAVNTQLYDLANDPHGIQKALLIKAYEARDKEMRSMEKERASMFAYVLSKISRESMDEISRAAIFPALEVSRDPLALWLLLKNTHMVATVSKVPTVVRKTARKEYEQCKQGEFESIVEYKRKFDAKADIYVASGNAALDAADQAMDFMYGLDDNRYADFKAEMVNDIAKGIMQPPANVNAIYVLASTRVVVKKGQTHLGGATFATTLADRNIEQETSSQGSETRRRQRKRQASDRRTKERSDNRTKSECE